MDGRRFGSEGSHGWSGLGGLTPRELIARSWRNGRGHDVRGQAARLAFFFLLALFPLLLLLVSLLGVALHSTALPENVLHRLLGMMAPDSASTLVDSIVREVRGTSSRGPLSFALLLLVWSVAQGMRAVIVTLDLVYDVRQQRPWLRRLGVTVLLTLALLVLLGSALVLMIYGWRFSKGLANAGFGEAIVVWPAARWTIIVVLAIAAFDVVYRFAPNIERPAWRWLLPGTLVGVALWLLASTILQLYVRYFDHFSLTYGSIGAVIALLLWLYLCGLAFLIGAELNAEIERASASQGAPPTSDSRMPPRAVARPP
ncbi:MAG TPA: YihY/virulence factor BrkB family protein [Caldimonas sp.]|jgi:membrane protein|nr:YihY/virulence factor BrkB family protein [Caldimonas sp.]HEX4235288.1 YihY/virulence factor BrkB family protein [Caldimonas sp.]